MSHQVSFHFVNGEDNDVTAKNGCCVCGVNFVHNVPKLTSTPLSTMLALEMEFPLKLMRKKWKERGKSTYLISVVEKPAKNINLNMAGKDVAQKLLNSGRIVQALGVPSVIHLAVPKWLLHSFLLVVESSVNCWSVTFAFFFTYDAQQIQLVPHPHSWALLVYYRDDYLLVWYEC